MPCAGWMSHESSCLWLTMQMYSPHTCASARTSAVTLSLYSLNRLGGAKCRRLAYSCTGNRLRPGRHSGSNCSTMSTLPPRRSRPEMQVPLHSSEHEAFCPSDPGQVAGQRGELQGAGESQQAAVTPKPAGHLLQPTSMGCHRQLHYLLADPDIGLSPVGSTGSSTPNPTAARR